MNIGLAVLLCVVGTVSFGYTASRPEDAFHWNSLLKKGINISEALEAPKEGEWGVVIKEDYFPVIKDAGFSSIRLPVRWNARAAEEAPYTVDPEFFKRVDQVLKWAMDREFVVVLDFHHYFELMKDPEGHKDRLLGIWLPTSASRPIDPSGWESLVVTLRVKQRSERSGLPICVRKPKPMECLGRIGASAARSTGSMIRRPSAGMRKY